MIKKLVVVGDQTDHGGTIISTTCKVRTSAGLMAVEGSQHSCPLKGHGVTPMMGSVKGRAGGFRMLVTGDIAGCGARVIMGSSSVTYKA